MRLVGTRRPSALKRFRKLFVFRSRGHQQEQGLNDVLCRRLDAHAPIGIPVTGRKWRLVARERTRYTGPVITRAFCCSIPVRKGTQRRRSRYETRQILSSLSCVRLRRQTPVSTLKHNTVSSRHRANHRGLNRRPVTRNNNDSEWRSNCTR